MEYIEDREDNGMKDNLKSKEKADIKQKEDITNYQKILTNTRHLDTDVQVLYRFKCLKVFI